MLLAMTQAGLMPSQKLQNKMEQERKAKEAYQAKKKAKMQEELAVAIELDGDFEIS
jgi:hypothetical protein